MLTDTSCAPIDLLNYLKEKVTTLKDGSSNESPLKLYVLDDEYEMPAGSDELRFIDFTPKRFKDEFLARKRLILIYQGTQIVMGMTVFEYAQVNKSPEVFEWTRSYIQYVDTTGLYTPRSAQSHLTRSLVKSYIRYCTKILNMGSLHFLATAKPAFLFAGSEFIAGKRPLASIKLINWWISVLCGLNSSSDRVFVYSPFEEANGSSLLRKRISGIPNWTYGLPYGPKSLCIHQIPLFEDDPKWRHFEATILDDDELASDVKRGKKKRARLVVEEGEEFIKPSASECQMSVKEFFESMQFRPEFRSEPSAFFTIQFDKSIRDRLSSVGASKLKKSDLATFGLKMLGGLTFESESAGKISSQKISGWLKLMAVAGGNIRAEEVRVDDKENEGRCVESGNNSDKPEVVNSLQSLIKKRPKIIN